MLRAWPTVKLNGRPRSIAARPDKDGLRLRWLQRRAEEHGFELIGEPSMTVEPFTVDRPGRRFGGNAVTRGGAEAARAGLSFQIKRGTNEEDEG